MQGLYEKYVRLGYYEQRHPVRYGIGAAIAMAALLWAAFWRMDAPIGGSATHALLTAVEYSFAFCLFRVLFSRSRRQRDRFARWAAKHPEPQAGEHPIASSTAPRPGSLHGRERLAWFGWTLLVALAVYWILGFLISATIGFGPGNGAVEAIIAAVIGLPVAIYLRLNWPPVRDWKSRT